MDHYVVDDKCTENEESDKVYTLEGVSSSGKGMEELESTTKTITRIDLDLAYHSEKLVNLHALLMRLLAYDNDLGAMTEDSYISADMMEKALVFDLLSGILDSEVREVDSFMDAIHAEIVDARQKISSCRDFKELCTILETKLDGSEESLKQSREQATEVKRQSAKLQMTSFPFRHENWRNDNAMDLSENSPLSNIYLKSKTQTAEQQKHVLRLLDKSLARELELEKKLSELKENEEDLKLKLHHREIVAFHMEEAAEVIWGRFLEAENASEVFMGISKEFFGRFQIMQFNMSGYIQREADVKSKLQDCMEQLKAKDTAIQNLESINAKYITENSEVSTLREKVKLLEKQLEESELQLNNANASNAATQEQLGEMENVFESLKESIYAAEIRAESAESKVTQLTDTNLELTEELNFLKGSGNTEKVSLLEKQLRELEIQLQHAKASSEASQEQQNMLYSAIWDMETLIEDLKSKVSKAESKTESVEEQCIMLSETNFELNKELNFMTGRVECLEASLDQANKEKVAGAKEIDLRTKIIMDMVMQLAIERERIQKQLNYLTKSNEMAEEKWNTEKVASEIVCDSRDGNGGEVLFSKNYPTNAMSEIECEEPVPSFKSFQAGG